MDISEESKVMAITVVISEKPYINDTAWNALRLAQTALVSGKQVNLFLLGDAVYISRKDQIPSENQPNLESLIKELIASGADVRVCTTCVNSRPYEPGDEYSTCFVGGSEGEKLGIQHLITGVSMGTMADLLEWTLNTKTISF